MLAITELSPASVQATAVAACAGDPSLSIVAEDHPAMSDIVHALGNWRRLVLTEQAEEPMKRRRAAYIAGVHAILEHGPAILREDVETIEAVRALDPSRPHVAEAHAALPEAQASTLRQMTLIGAATAVANDPRMVHLARWAALPIDTYTQFLSALEPLFVAIVVRADGAALAPRKPYFAFAAAVLSFVTDKPVTEEMVRSHVGRKRPTHWERPGWREPFLVEEEEPPPPASAD